jgi:L-ascorbate metabolism protein UlaG (beta-lactamase superfamily)
VEGTITRLTWLILLVVVMRSSLGYVHSFDRAGRRNSSPVAVAADGVAGMRRGWVRAPWTRQPRADTLPRAVQGVRITYVGHATVLVNMDGTRVLTDPVLRSRLAHLHRHHPVAMSALEGVDAVLISHAHMDHLDMGSLDMLGRDMLIVTPPGIGRLLRRRNVVEVGVGGSTQIGTLEVRPTPAEHDGRRFPVGPAVPAVGYRICGSRCVYFAGDTGPFDGMSEIGRAGVDVALLPVSGWGKRLPAADHLGPMSAAEALPLLTPEVAVPIHWGTLSRIWGMPMDSSPAEEFARNAAQLAPDVRVVIVHPGDTATL